MCTVTHRDGRVTQLDQVSSAKLCFAPLPSSRAMMLTVSALAISQVYIRGPSIRFYVVPDMLAQAPMCVVSFSPTDFSLLTVVASVHRFKRIGPNAMKGRGIGTARGRATIMRAQCKFFHDLIFDSFDLA